MARTRVAVLAGHPLAARYIVHLLAHDRQVEVVGQQAMVGPRRGAVSAADVLLVDWSSSRLDLAELLRVIRLRHAQGRIVVLGPESDAAAILRWLYLGIHGYVPFGDVPRRLIGAVKAVGEGGYWIPAPVLASYARQNENMRNDIGRHTALSDREQQVLQLVVRGLANKEIAEILHISERTVKFHVSNVFSKLQVHGRKSLMEGLVQAALPA